MSYLSCINTLKALLTTALPAFTTIKRRGEVPLPYTPLLYPMVILYAGDAAEERFGLPTASPGDPIGGRKLRTWPLNLEVWDYEPGPTWDDTAFLTAVETIEQTIRANPRLAGAADTATSFVVTAGEGGPAGLRTHIRYYPDGTNSVLRYAELQCRVREGIHG